MSSILVSTLGVLDATKLSDPQISASKTMRRLLVSFASYMTRSNDTVMDMITPCQSGLLNASQSLAHVSGLSGMFGIRVASPLGRLINPASAALPARGNGCGEPKTKKPPRMQRP